MYIDVECVSVQESINPSTIMYSIAYMIMLELVSEQNYVIALSTMLFASVGKMLLFLAATIEY